jgi:hypothetical protein
MVLVVAVWNGVAIRGTSALFSPGLALYTVRLLLVLV